MTRVEPRIKAFIYIPFWGGLALQAEPERDFYFMMTLKDGRFYKDGQPYPIEFGNKDQILLIEKVKQLKGVGISPRLIFDDQTMIIDTARLLCVCGSTIELKGFEEGQIIRCTGCKFTYKVFLDDCDFPYLKIV